MILRFLTCVDAMPTGLFRTDILSVLLLLSVVRPVTTKEPVDDKVVIIISYCMDI